MSKRIPSPREIINNFSPYLPGMSIEEVKQKYNLSQIIKLASNENLWGTSPRALNEMKKELNNVYLYPRSEPVELKKEISKRLSVSRDSIIMGNGTDEIIELIAKTFLSDEDKIVVSANSFIRYKMAGNLMGAEVTEVPQNYFSADLEGILNEIDSSTKIVYIDNPCNPTGTFAAKDEIKCFLEDVEQLREPPLIVFDEAYFEYAVDSSYCSALEFKSMDVPLMVLRTFSKIYGLAGLRIGYGISNPQIVSFINRIRPPFNTNRLAQTAALGALKDQEFISMVARETEKEKKYLYEEFHRLKLFCIKSAANFIMVNFGVDNVKLLCEYLLRKGIILRPLTGYDFNDYIRVTIGKREQNEKLIDEIESFLREIRGRRNEE